MPGDEHLDIGGFAQAYQALADAVVRAAPREESPFARLLREHLDRDTTDLPVVAMEMRQVLDEAREAEDSMIEGKALTALAEVALLREGDLPKATELIDAALDVLPGDGRFTALGVRGSIAYWVGDFEARERVGEEALEIARRLERKDLEAQARDAAGQGRAGGVPDAPLKRSTPLRSGKYFSCGSDGDKGRDATMRCERGGQEAKRDDRRRPRRCAHRRSRLRAARGSMRCGLGGRSGPDSAARE